MTFPFFFSTRHSSEAGCVGPAFAIALAEKMSCSAKAMRVGEKGTRYSAMFVLHV